MISRKKVFKRWITNSKYNIDVDALISSIKSLDTKMTTQESYKALNKLGYSSDKYNKIRLKNFYRQLDKRVR